MNCIAPAEDDSTNTAPPAPWDGRPKTNLDGKAIAKALFEFLIAKPSFDIWGFGAGQRRRF
jgi:hypothetical protein